MMSDIEQVLAEKGQLPASSYKRELEKANRELARLRKRVDELLGANNREMERRRESAEKARFLRDIDPDIYHAIKQIVKEHGYATAKYPPFASAHEGYAILKEEVDELWDEVKKKPGEHQMIGFEARQVGAMAVRMIAEFGE